MSKRPDPSRPKDKRPPKDKPPFPAKPKKAKTDQVRIERIVADWPVPNRQQCARLLQILEPHLPAELDRAA